MFDYIRAEKFYLSLIFHEHIKIFVIRKLHEIVNRASSLPSVADLFVIFKGS